MSASRKKFKVKGGIGLLCKKCNIIKLDTEFYWDNSNLRYRCHCKQCDIARAKKSYTEYYTAKPCKITLGSPEAERYYAQTISDLGL